ncbi:MAG: hypothetical protein QME51_04115 [Planctomycetota bacterium]|nr:hypothetical protein [Planctomycetota bacterium]
MNFLTIQNEIKRRAKNYASELGTSLKLAINSSYLNLWALENWWFSREEVRFDTVAKYTTGTVTVTKNSATVTGSGTTFTKAMEGRLFIRDNASKSYRILTFVSTTSLTLDTVYQDTTESEVSYGIYKDLYTPDDRIIKVLTAKQNKTPRRLRFVPKPVMDKFCPNPTSIGDPKNYSLYGKTTAAYYKTGTISITNGATAVTGSGTTFDSSMVGRVIKFGGDDIEYIVDSVANTTSLTLAKSFDGTTISGGTYEIGSAGIEQIQLYPIPEVAMGITLITIRRPLWLLADGDVPLLPEQWQKYIVEDAYVAVTRDRETDLTRIDKAEQDRDRILQGMFQYHYAEEDTVGMVQSSQNLVIEDDNAWAFREDDSL